MEIVADIAYDAGYTRLRIDNNSRVRINEIVHWAMEFNALHKDKDWDEDDYLSLAGVFIDQKISQYQKPFDMPCPHCGQHSIKSEKIESADEYYSLICEECGCQIVGDTAQKLIEEHIEH